MRWKSERAVHYLIGNSNKKIRRTLAIAASPDSTTEARQALLTCTAWIFSWRRRLWPQSSPSAYTALDYRALEALGHARHDVRFYEEYLDFCNRLAESNIVKPQGDLPGPTALRALGRALWEWSRSHGG